MTGLGECGKGRRGKRRPTFIPLCTVLLPNPTSSPHPAHHQVPAKTFLTFLPGSLPAPSPRPQSKPPATTTVSALALWLPFLRFLIHFLSSSPRITSKGESEPSLPETLKWLSMVKVKSKFLRSAHSSLSLCSHLSGNISAASQRAELVQDLCVTSQGRVRLMRPKVQEAGLCVKYKTIPGSEYSEYLCELWPLGPELVAHTPV